MAYKIVLLPGDGIGPEIIEPAVQVLDAVAQGELEYERHLFGGAAIDEYGRALTNETLEACRRADAVLLAAVGGPKWDTTDAAKPRPEQGLLGCARASACSPTSVRSGRSPRCTRRAR
jgi:3-isopropylmalate dehydrogenase